MAVMGQHVGKEILEALGLPSNVTSVDLRFASGEIVTATVHLLPERSHVTQVASILRRYELREREQS